MAKEGVNRDHQESSEARSQQHSSESSGPLAYHADRLKIVCAPSEKTKCMNNKMVKMDNGTASSSSSIEEKRMNKLPINLSTTTGNVVNDLSSSLALNSSQEFLRRSSEYCTLATPLAEASTVCVSQEHSSWIPANSSDAPFHTKNLLDVAMAQKNDTLQSDVPLSTRDRPSIARCLCCRKKLGLLGFKCKCGDLFCSLHRYSDRHNCRFDYRTMAKEAIAKANPIVKAPKIWKL